mgnify:CR=1 FL=1
MTARYLTKDELIHALELRDLSCASQGEHAMQMLLSQGQAAIESWLPCTTQTLKANPLVWAQENYDALGYPKDGPAREARYTRYLNDQLMLRTQMSSHVPQWLKSWSGSLPSYRLLMCPGLVYRRDCIDRWHCAEPHQLDMWLLTDKNARSKALLPNMVQRLLTAWLPNHSYCTIESPHPYTDDGIQMDVRLHKGPDQSQESEWIEIGEAGWIAEDLLQRMGLDPKRWSGVALGVGLDRILMLRKGIPDIRLLRNTEPRVAMQMQDLSPWQNVSKQPKIERDLSVAVPIDLDEDTLGDQIRTSLGSAAEWIEVVEVLSEADYLSLPQTALHRLGMHPDQKNWLLRLIIRHPTETLTNQQANELRNQVYQAVHQGQRQQWASN